MKVISVIFGFIMLFMLTGCSYNSLDEAIQQKFDKNISVIYVDEKKHKVIFADKTVESEDQSYYFNTYDKSNDKYRYSTNKEDGGWSVASNGGTPFLIRYIKRENDGNILWGIIRSNKEVKNLELVLKSKKNIKEQIKVRIPVKNNAFIDYPTQSIFNLNSKLNKEWNFTAKALDKNNNVIATTHILNED